MHIQRNVNLVNDESVFEGREVVSFTWKGDIRANGIIFHCQTCKRITIVQIMGHLKENLPIDYGESFAVGARSPSDTECALERL